MYNTNWAPLIVAFGLVFAFGGWLVIEGLLWLLSHISFTFS
ncbi:hypothetical protein [Vibrio phage vB_VibM_10AMN]|uniref:Uncharacterized protein n=1 Tax=Staphylococcus phage vB_VibM_10AMN12 TaxID=3076785 RepID=A0AA96R2B0_9CAUD|nr:hypothetical protein [Vibrio phage vB_VibM_10AMN]WNO47379.1 hypothetical protein [Staphylococcus phage vB_VibM_10AMN12]